MSGKVSNRPTVRAASANNPQQQELLQKLRAAWGIATNAPLTVIGQLRNRSKDRNVFFLEGLENPASGVGLVYPLPTATRPASAFVPPPEIAWLTDPQAALSESLWAIAELQLSSIEEREKHKNPYLCSVRLGTLRLLSEVPEQWSVLVTGLQSARRIAATAQEAIEEQISEELARLREEVAEAEAIKSGNQTELKSLQNAIWSKQVCLDSLNAQVLRETQFMEDRFRRLADLLAEKGRRLVALDLIDVDDLEALLPHGDPANAGQGHDFHEVLNGDFARLAPFVQARLWKRDMLFSKALLRDFLALIRTHDLVVLAGDSGSGKTSLIRAVADSIDGRCTVIPVKPNWTGPEDLMGYYNPIERSYHPTPFLQALQAAEREPEVLHFICLDEMNLARVEHYFSDFLSLLEVRAEPPLIPLYTSDEERHTVMENGLFLALEAEARQRAGLPADSTLEDLLKNETANRILHQLGGFKDAESVLVHHGRLRRALAASLCTPTELRFPVNLRIFGAINVDETTHYLSPKVLDRVHVLRFRNPVLTDWEALEAEIESFDSNQLSAPLRLVPDQLGPRTDYPAFDRKTPAGAFLTELARDHLDPLGVEFGLRAIRQSLGYLQAAEIVGIDAVTALNNVILHKVLPKLTLDTARTGTDGRKRRDVLIGMRDYLNAHLNREALAPNVEDSVAMLDRLITAADGNNGIANYWLR